MKYLFKYLYEIFYPLSITNITKGLNLKETRLNNPNSLKPLRDHFPQFLEINDEHTKS